MTISKIKPRIVVTTPDGDITIPLPAVDDPDDLALINSALTEPLTEMGQPAETEVVALKRIFDDAITHSLVTLHASRGDRLIRARRRARRESGAGEV
jgi:hypothetical protein